MSAPTIGFVGLTHLGINSAAAAAARGFATVGYDPDAALARRLAAGDLPVVEPGLDEAMASHAERLRFTAAITDLGACDVIYVSPDVATDDHGASDLSSIDGLLSAALSAAPPDAAVVVLSQVPPGFTRDRGGGRASLYYQVETLVFGRAFERAMHPERFIVGCADPEAPLHAGYAAFLEAFGCPILPMRHESAELAKIAINCCLVASICTANTLAELCEHIGADWSEIAPALRLDRRIGAHAYLAPGLGLSGGNLERDLATVMRLSAVNGTDSGVVSAWMANSRHRKQWAARVLAGELPRGERRRRVAVLGLAYKENTHSTKNSPALALVEALADCDVTVFDPVVPASAAPTAKTAASALAALAGADAVAIMTPWDEFRGLDAAEIAGALAGRLVIDPYRLLSSEALAAAGLDHFVLGAGPRRAGEGWGK